ncbi:hypothetical protein CLV63_12134 [Murinocardiopsis flavida]|uniref:DNA-directed RNA polymerase specialized sigma24 family protein n=1 Tax=Murinocardiopsis flavida TaxID=645275 RepID=A0A2P8D117_9ACTN|nr:sigma-70 family RNA polymerase sigma factor [Murinocardiopsis flavida]PSK90909.1 hypothetical protein CLV63_12134 [Murinocardiopsis flavida]
MAVLRSGRVPGERACALLIDAHGDALYERCAALVGRSDLLTAVLRDTLVVARAHIGRLADPSRLREWLLALAEAECARHPVGGDADAGPPESGPGPSRAPGGEWPVELRLRVLSGVAAPALAGYRAHIAARAKCFDGDGFPVPARPARPTRPSSYLLPGLFVGLCALLLLLFVLAEIAGIGPGLLTGGSARSAPLN